MVKDIWTYMFYCAVECPYMCFLFSGGRNILVTGSGFDLIQTAVMMVQGENFTVSEVSKSILFAFSLIYCHPPFHLSLSPLIIHL